jgi:hypothetical protein
MQNAADMMAIFNRSIEDYHQKDHVDTPISNPFELGTEAALLYQKNWIDTVQWHLEDIIRDPEISPEEALLVKRRIDSSNQERTDLVEQIDDRIIDKFKAVDLAPNAPLNTESPGWAIDRLSILALKIYHMAEEASRADIEDELRQKNEFKLKVLRVQETDLIQAIDQLLRDMGTGKRQAKVYRQMKMYNDPELNPVLYKKDS